MECSAAIQCPYCGQKFDLVLDTSIASQRFTTDCEVCCRPFEVFAECEPGEVLSLTVEGGVILLNGTSTKVFVDNYERIRMMVGIV